MVLEAIKAFIFGIVEGITEWLPISSTGHMMLLNEFMPLNVSDAFYDTFLVVIQLGAIMAVVILYFHKLNPFSSLKSPEEKHETWGIWFKVVVGSIPAAVAGFALDDWMEEHLMNGSVGYVVVACTLIGYGIIFIVMERRNRRRIAYAQACETYRRETLQEHGTFDDEQRETPTPSASEQRRRGVAGRRRRPQPEESELDASSAISKVNTFSEMSYKRAFLIGIFEALAIIPGTSRSGSIIIGSMLLGTSRTIATEFAFFLAIPIMFGWSLLKFVKHGFAYTATEWVIFAVAIVTSFVVSVLAIKFLIGYIKKNDFTAFGVYRIIVGVVILSIALLRVLGVF